MDTGSFSSSSFSIVSSKTKSQRPLPDRSCHAVKRQVIPSQNHVSVSGFSSFCAFLFIKDEDVCKIRFMGFQFVFSSCS